MSWGNSHLSSASSNGNRALSWKPPTSEHFHPPNSHPGPLRKSGSPREGTHTCVSSEGCIRRAMQLSGKKASVNNMVNPGAFSWECCGGNGPENPPTLGF